MLARDQSDGDAYQNSQAAEDLDGSEACAEPGPFDQRAKWSGQALNQQHGKAGTQTRQRLEQRDIAKADPEDAAEEKDGESIALQADSKAVRPNAKQQGGASKTPEVGFSPANEFGRPMTANHGDGKQDCGQERREHARTVMAKGEYAYLKGRSQWPTLENTRTA